MARSSGLDIIPVEIWDHIVSMLHQDHLQSLSLVSKLFLTITNRHLLSLNILIPTAELLPSILPRFPNITHLSLSDFHGDVVPVLHRIADFQFPLQTLDLSGQDYLPVEALQRFPASVLSGVKSLNISYLSQGVDDADLNKIANFFPNLEELDLSCIPIESSYDRDDDFGAPKCCQWYFLIDNKTATANGVSVLASKCLRRINLRGNDWVCDEVLISICRNCPNLEEIVLEGCGNVTVKGIAFALTTCRNLKTIEPRINWFWLMTTPNSVFRGLNLSHIVFSGIFLSDDLFHDMANAKLPLKSFCVIDCFCMESSLTNGLLPFLETYDSLHHLALLVAGAHFLSDAVVETLASSLTKVRSVRLRSPRLSDSALVTFIQHCPFLETLEFTHTKNIKDGSGLRGITNAEIRSLDLSLNYNLSDECLENIASACPKLERLILRSCPRISNKGVGKILSNCHSLKHLKMSGCFEVKSLGLELMNTDDNQHLELQFLGISESGLDDKALIELAEKCPHLRSLNVRGCNGLTTQGVKQAVDKLTRLKEINLRDCKNVSNSIVPWMVFNKQPRGKSSHLRTFVLTRRTCT